ncbi:MAG: Glutathione hydrolase proenzyme [Burkholderia gladioli]|nr:MAG: Glutathione hydrolase proenzyme [Burkholderia gladioli]
MPTTLGVEPTPQAAHLLGEAGRLAYADRARYVGDPDRVPAPAGDWQRLIAPTYLAQRRQRLGDTSLGHAAAGVPTGSSLATAFGDDVDALSPPPAASELSVVDRNGAVVSMSSSLGDPFGARLMVRGFLLNDALTGFSRLPRDHTTGRSRTVWTAASAPAPRSRPNWNWCSSAARGALRWRSAARTRRASRKRWSASPIGA